jgi:hypothetical protein
MLVRNPRYLRNVGIFVVGRDGGFEAFYPGFLSVEAIRQGRKPLVDCYKEQTEKTIMMTLRQFSAEHCDNFLRSHPQFPPLPVGIWLI